MVTSNLAYKAEIAPGADSAINSNPLKWCSVSLSEVVSRGKRLEASVFDVEAVHAHSILTNGKYPAVNLVALLMEIYHQMSRLTLYIDTLMKCYMLHYEN